MTVTATVLLNGFYTSARTNNSDLPQFAVPRDAGDSFPTSGLGGTMRQSRIQARAFLAGVGGGDFTAELDVDFWGGQQPSNGGRTFPLLRIRRAWAEQAWERFRVLVGQEAPPIVELNPSSLGSLGLSSLSSSGNLWLWIPQIRATGALVAGSRSPARARRRILAPTGIYGPGPLSHPAGPGRADQAPYSAEPAPPALRHWGDTAGEMSVGGHLGWLSTTGDSLLQSRAAAILLQLPLGRIASNSGARHSPGRGSRGWVVAGSGRISA